MENKTLDNEVFRRSLGEALRSIRESRMLSRHAILNKVSFSADKLCDIELGNRSIAVYDACECLRAAGVPVSELGKIVSAVYDEALPDSDERAILDDIVNRLVAMEKLLKNVLND